VPSTPCCLICRADRGSQFAKDPRWREVDSILVVHTTLPLSKKQAGYDHDQLGSFIEFVGGHMEEAGAEKAEIVSTDGVWGVELTNPALSES
jgi:hypothetical protein